MEVRENEHQKETVRFTGRDISMVAAMLDKVNSTLEIMFFHMERKKERAFVLMLFSASRIDIGTLLEKEKRETDILFEIDSDEPLYAVICQDTKIDGGYHFAERLRDTALEKGADEVYCTLLEVRNTSHKIKYIIYRIMELFLQAKQAGKQGEIVFKTLN